MRGRSYTPSPPPPPRGHGRRVQSPTTPRGCRYGELSATLIVRNLSHDCIFRDRRHSPSRYYSRSPSSSRSPLPSKRRHSSRRKEGYDRRRRSYSRSPAYSGSRGRRITSKSRSISRSRDLPTSLFVRHLSHDCRQEDLKKSFKQFGPLKDIHLPRDRHTG